MEIRQAAAGDIPKIVALLKTSLGETLMPKTEQYWRWKHVENPFGYSPVLVCWEGAELVGVRAFMQWKWVNQGRVFNAVRAVDTATHPAHQGKGIFRKLTLQLVTTCEQQGDHFVFNTPNTQSKPGYLKMGWIEAGKLPVCLEINRPVQLIRKLLGTNPEEIKADNSSMTYYLAHKNLESLLEQHLQQATRTVTKVSIPYLKWRYVDVPVANYVAVGEEHNGDLTGLIIARVKHTRIGTELRITDAFWKGKFPGKGLIQQLKELKRKFSIDYCTLSNIGTHDKRILGQFVVNLPVGPIVTLRSLAMKDLSSFTNFKNWTPSLGDLELF